jgi:hypothetical protein
MHTLGQLCGRKLGEGTGDRRAVFGRAARHPVERVLRQLKHEDDSKGTICRGLNTD